MRLRPDYPEGAVCSALELNFVGVDSKHFRRQGTEQSSSSQPPRPLFRPEHDGICQVDCGGPRRPRLILPDKAEVDQTERAGWAGDPSQAVPAGRVSPFISTLRSPSWLSGSITES